MESIETYAAGSYVPYLAPNDAMSSAKVVEFPMQCTLYRDINYSGPSKTFNKATSSLVGIGFNDKASSAKVRGHSGYSTSILITWGTPQFSSLVIIRTQLLGVVQMMISHRCIHYLVEMKEIE